MPSAIPAPADPAPATSPRVTPTGRLGQGELRRQVAAHLASHPALELTPGEIAIGLDRSAGAVANALETLTAHGDAEKVSERPRRYRATASTHGAAEGATVTPRTARPATPRPCPPEEPPASAGTAAPATTGPVTRPNGMAYHPRALADLPDVDVLRRLRDAGIPALLYGPPGTGKTSLVEAAFPDLITVAGDGDTAVADFVGEYTQADDGSYEFVYGPLVVAMREGRVLFIDDATLVSPKVLACVYSGLDGRGQVTVKAHKGETITAEEGFYVIAGHNPGVHGAILTEALASRFSFQVSVGSDYDLACALKIDSRAVRVARNLATRVAKGEIGWTLQLRELIAFQKIADVLGTDAAVANLAGIAPEEDRDIVAAAIATAFGRPVTPLALGRQI